MEYKLVRSKRRRTAICIADGVVTVKAPMREPIADIERFVAQKQGWIDKKLSEYAQKTAFLKDVIDGTAALFYGKTLKIAVSEQNKRIATDPGVLYLPQKYAEDAASRQRAIAAWYKREALKSLSQRLYELSEYTGLKYKSFCLTNAKSKWGSCDSDCNIRLNWRLVMLDGAYVDYVIIHELAHTAHHDHSAAFWAKVESFYPKYKIARKQLKMYSVLMPLYR